MVNMVTIEQAHSEILNLVSLQALCKTSSQHLSDDIKHVLAALVAAERERAAQVADASYDAGTGYSLVIASKIREGAE